MGTRALESRPDPFPPGAGYTLLSPELGNQRVFQYLLREGIVSSTSQASRAGRGDLVAPGLASTRDQSGGA